jgi:hypothetical protein
MTRLSRRPFFQRPRPWVTLAALLAISCTGVVASRDSADDGAVFRLEGDALASAMNGAGLSDVFEAPTEFVRLAAVWDSAEGIVPEIRLSADREVWTDWQALEVHFDEDGAFMGRLDGAGADRFYQFRVPEGATAPTFIAFDPIDSLDQDVGEPPTAAELADPGDDFDDALDAELVTLSAEVAGIASAHTGTGINLTVHSRAAWGARAPRCRSGTSPFRITFHHTVTPTNDSMSVPARLRQIQAFHMDGRGWCDIGYNYLIARNGTVWRGRGARWLGAHVGDANTGNVGIAFVGTHTQTHLTALQRTNAGKFIARLHKRFGIPLDRSHVRGHRDHAATTCPGNGVFQYLPAIIRNAQNAH